MTEPGIEGTFRLDGLLEGPLLSADDTAYLQEFVAQARQEHLSFSLTHQFNRFSLLGDNQAVTKPTSTHSIDTLVTQHLNRLLRHFPREDRGRLMSTVRSIEYKAGQAIHTLYTIGPQGEIQTEQRVVPTSTRPPASVFARIQWLVYASVLVLLLGASSVFIPYRSWIDSVIHPAPDFDCNSLTVTAPHFDALLDHVAVKYDPNQSAFVVTCLVKPSFPRTSEALNRAWLSTRTSLFDRLTIEALARGQIRCQLLDDSGKLLGQWIVPMQWSQNSDHQFSLTIPFHPQTKTIQLAF